MKESKSETVSEALSTFVALTYVCWCTAESNLVQTMFSRLSFASMYLNELLLLTDLFINLLMYTFLDIGMVAHVE